MACEGCKAHDENRFTFESAMAMAERTIKRLWLTVMLLIVLFVGSNIAWLIYESQFETVEESSTTENDINALQWESEVNIVNGGEMTYATDSKD